MSEFFNSEIIQGALEEINDLQEKIYGTAMSFGIMSNEEKIEHIDMMVSLLEKQKIMYTRLSLSDDPAAVEMKENLKKIRCLDGISTKYGYEHIILDHGKNCPISQGLY